jgi:small ligand-binding sensory domain FIST
MGDQPEVFSEVVRQPLPEDLAPRRLYLSAPVDAERQRIALGRMSSATLLGLIRQGVIAVGDYIRQGQKMVFTLRDGSVSRETS